MNPGTLPPWLSPWASGLVYGQRVFRPGTEPGNDAIAVAAAIAAAQAAAPVGPGAKLRPRLTILAYGRDEPSPIIRFGSWSEGGSGSGAGEGGSVPPPAGAGAPQGPGGSASPASWERVPLDHAPWQEDVPAPVRHRPRYDTNNIPGEKFTDVTEEVTGPRGAADAGLVAWNGVLRGWVAGATVLVLLVLVARLMERFLDWKDLLRQRRRHNEWHRANARASRRMASEGCYMPGLEREQPLPAELGEMRSGDLPPPYSAQGPAGGAGAQGDKPPPYVACRAGAAPGPGSSDPEAILQYYEKILIAWQEHNNSSDTPPDRSLRSFALFAEMTEAMDIANSNANDGTDATPKDTDGANTADDAPNGPDISSNNTDGNPIVTDDVPNVSYIAQTGLHVAPQMAQIMIHKTDQ